MSNNSASSPTVSPLIPLTTRKPMREQMEEAIKQAKTETYESLRTRELECEKMYKDSKAVAATLSPETSLMLTEAIAYLERTWQTAKGAAEAEAKRLREISRKAKRLMNLEDFMFDCWFDSITDNADEEIALKHQPDDVYHQIASRATPVSDVHDWVVHQLLDRECYWSSDGDWDEHKDGCHIMANSINLASLHRKMADSYSRMLFLA